MQSSFLNQTTMFPTKKKSPSILFNWINKKCKTFIPKNGWNERYKDKISKITITLCPLE